MQTILALSFKANIQLAIIGPSHAKIHSHNLQVFSASNRILFFRMEKKLRQHFQSTGATIFIQTWITLFSILTSCQTVIITFCQLKLININQLCILNSEFATKSAVSVCTIYTWTNKVSTT